MMGVGLEGCVTKTVWKIAGGALVTLVIEPTLRYMSLVMWEDLPEGVYEWAEYLRVESPGRAVVFFVWAYLILLMPLRKAIANKD